MTVGEVRPGYEVWHPNRERPGVVATRLAIVLLLAATAALAAFVTIAGFSLLTGGAGMGGVALAIAAIYALFAYRVARWSRGALPVAAALSTILAIFCAVGVDSWFARDKAGFEGAAIPVPAIGALVALLAVLQVAVIVLAFYGFAQNWHVEEERAIGSGEDYGAGAPQPPRGPQPA